MKKLIFFIIILATAIFASSCGKHTKKCHCDNYQYGRILNSFNCTTEDYNVENCTDITGIVYYNGKNGLECY